MMNRHHIRAAFPAALFIAVLCLSGATPARAQKIDWGPFHLDIGMVAGFEYTDNVDTSETNRVEDLKIRIGPTVTGGVTLPITLRGGEKLTLQTGFSYEYKFSLTQQNRQTFSSPITVSLVLPIELENWTVVASESFTLRNDPLESTVAVTETTATQYQNTASIGATRNFGRVAISFGIDRQDKFSPDQPELEEARYQASFTPAFFFRDNYSVFWRNSVGLVEPQAITRQESMGWSSEVGLSGQITPYLNGVISVGFAHSHLFAKRVGPGEGIFGGIFDPEILPEDNIDGISSNFGLTYSHPLRPNTSYSVSFFRSPGVTAVLNKSSIQETTGATLGIAHRLTPLITLSPVMSWTHAEDVSKTGAGEKTDLFALDVNVGRPFSRNLSGRLSYRFQNRSSNIEGNSYYVNRITATLTYRF